MRESEGKRGSVWERGGEGKGGWEAKTPHNNYSVTLE